jgi:WD40 repeat protein/GTPase SAR1 family protein
MSLVSNQPFSNFLYQGEGRLTIDASSSPIDNSQDELENNLRTTINGISQIVLNPEKKVIPTFADDLEDNKLIHDALIELRKKELEEISQKKEILQLYTPLEGRSDLKNKAFDVFQEVMSFLSDDKERCLLLMGDAGAGKTTFTYSLSQSLWKEHEKAIVKDKPIPVLIPMITIGDVKKKLLDEHFEKRGLSSKGICLLKKHVRFVFILEGYDEQEVFNNLYRTNRLDRVACKVITSCRSQALLSQENGYRLCFDSEIEGNKLKEIVLCPFTHDKIEEYMRAYVKKQGEEVEGDRLLCKKTLSQLSYVLNLAGNPCILSMIVPNLLELIKEKKEKETDDDKMRMIQEKLYDIFIDSWFKRQLEKLSEQGKWKLKNGKFLQTEDFRQCNETIAAKMIWDKTTNLKIKDLNTEADYPFLHSGYLLKKEGEQCRFIDDSLRLHFAAKEIFHGILSRSSFAFGHPLNEKLIVDEPELLSSCIDRFKDKPDLEELLFKLIKESKNASWIATAAANAITILAQAGTLFPDRNFRGVRIPGANLSGAFLDGFDFTDADLRQVRFIEASLNGVNFTGAYMDGVEFGQLPLISLSPENSVEACVYSPNRTWIAIGDDQGCIHLYDAVKGSFVKKLTESSFNGSINSLCFIGKDSQFLAVGSNAGLRIWDVNSTKQHTKLTEDTDKVFGVSFSPTENILAVGGDDEICLWDMASGEKTQTLKGHTGPVNSVSFSPDGEILASGSTDKTVCLWDVSSGNALHVLKGHTGSMNRVSFSPDGKTLASGSTDKTVRLWDVTSGKEIRIFKGHMGPVNSVSFSPDGKILASGSDDKTVCLWDVSSGTEIRIFKGHSGPVKSVSFSSDGKTLASGSEDKTVRLWEISFTTLLQHVKKDDESTEGIPVENSFKYDIKLEKDYTISVCKKYSKKTNILKGHTELITSVSLSSDGKTLASGSADKTVCLWKIFSGEKKILTGHQASVSCVSFSSDGNTLASGSSDKTICLWEVSSGDKKRTLTGHLDYIISVSFSRDGKTLASSSSDKTVHLWDVFSGNCLHKITSFRQEVKSIHWDLNEKYLITKDEYGGIKKFQIEDKTKTSFLVWSSLGTQGLHCQETIIKFVTGLSPNNQALLEQNKSRGQVSQRSSEDIMLARDQKETVEDSCKTIFARDLSGQPIGLAQKAQKNWAVSIGNKKGNEHAFLILEGIEDQKRVIYQAEVFLNNERKKTEYNTVVYGMVAFGYANVQVKPITVNDAEKLVKECHFRSEAITSDQAKTLLQLIGKDAENNELEYNNFGDSPVYGFGQRNQEYGNCLTFAEKWLRGIKVDFINESSWKNTLFPVAITSRRPYW